MTQTEFSKHSKKYIAEYHPAFLESIELKQDSSFECSLTSKKGRLSIWIATFDSEITVGFEDFEGKTNWHTHMSLFGANNPTEELNTMSKLINSILSDSEPLVYSTKTGFTLTYDPEEDIRNKAVDENIIVYKWSDL